MFIDDILIYSKCREDHSQHLCVVLSKLTQQGLYVKLSKCIFWPRKIEFLEHMISEAGVAVDPENIESIMKCPAPNNGTEVSRILL